MTVPRPSLPLDKHDLMKHVKYRLQAHPSRIVYRGSKSRVGFCHPCVPWPTPRYCGQIGHRGFVGKTQFEKMSPSETLLPPISFNPNLAFQNPRCNVPQRSRPDRWVVTLSMFILKTTIVACHRDRSAILETL